MLFDSTNQQKGLPPIYQNTAYRKMLLAMGLWLVLIAVNRAPVFAQASWLQSKASNDIAYFLFATPARIERYDLNNASWLTTISLTATPTAFTVDSDGLYIAFDRRVSHFTLEGTAEMHLANTATAMTALFTINEFLYINHSAYPYGKLTSVNKLTGLTIDSKDYLYKVLNGLSVGRTIGKAFARNSGNSPADIVQVVLNADGTLGTASDSPYHGAYPDATKTFIFPNESRVVDSAGIVYNTSDLTYNNRLAGAVDNIAFYGDLPIVLRGGEIIAHNNALQKTGSYTPPQSPAKIYLHGEQVFTFWHGSARGVEVAAFALALLNPATPGEGMDPVGLLYTPDAVALGTDGILYLFSKTYLSIFRWSLPARTYLPTIGLSQVPSYFTFAPTTNRLYLAYASGKLTQIQPNSTLLEMPFANAPAPICGLASAEQYLFVCNSAGSVTTQLLYHPDGTLRSQANQAYMSKAYVWNNANRKLYFLRDNLSPNDLQSVAIDETGTFGAQQETPYHTSDGILHPIRVAPDGSIVLLGSGRIYDAVNLNHLRTLANNISDAGWFGGQLYTVRALNTQSQIQRWRDTAEIEKVVTIDNSTAQLLPTNEGMLAVTAYRGLPHFRLFDGDLNLRYQSPTLAGLQATNNSPVGVGRSVIFESQLAGIVGTVLYTWDFGDGTQGTGKMVGHGYTTAGIYTATVSAQNAVDTITATTKVTITNDIPIKGLVIVGSRTTKLGQQTELQAMVQAGTNISYAWTLGDGSATYGDQLKYTYAAHGTYTVTVTATNGASSVTASATITITEAGMACVPIEWATIVVPSTDYRVGNPIFFNVYAGPLVDLTTTTYQWFVNGVAVRPIIAPNETTFDYTFTNAGTYIINVMVSNPCSIVSGTTSMTILPIPADQPDLSHSSKSVTSTSIEAGDMLTYTIYLRNRHATVAEVEFTEDFPDHTIFLPDTVRVSAGELLLKQNELRWFGSVISGTPVLLTYTVIVESAPPGTTLASFGWADVHAGHGVALSAAAVYEPDYRFSINHGALYTNQPQVTLTYHWDTAHNIQFAKFSNDSGFGADAGTTDWLPINAQTSSYANWPLTAHPSSLLPRTVYVLFRSADGSQYGPFQDDIILDTLPPNLRQVTWLATTQRSAQATATEAQVRIMASDENSGITTIELSTQADFAIATPYAMPSNTLDVTLPTPTTALLYVRARDRAGNHSAVQMLSASNRVQIFLPVVTR